MGSGPSFVFLLLRCLRSQWFLRSFSDTALERRMWGLVMGDIRNTSLVFQLLVLTRKVVVNIF